MIWVVSGKRQTFPAEMLEEVSQPPRELMEAVVRAG
jgi:hypothetical protein